jgi:hypothetical protein
MNGEQYYLFLIAKDGKEYRAYSKPLTMEEIDRRTTRYNSKKELIARILQNNSLGLKPSDVSTIEIRKKPKASEEVYTKERGPLYSEDRDVLNIEKTKRELNIKYHDTKFVLEFIKMFKNIPNFVPLIYEIQAGISTDKSYFEPFDELITKYSKTYKGCRNIYLAMRDYDKALIEKGKAKISLSPDEVYVPMSNEEQRRNELQYLSDNDRECLDISDFDHHRDMSPFDGSKEPKCK